MTKAELIFAIQKKADLPSKAKTDEVFKAFIGTITETLGKGETVSLPRFGTFKIVERAGRIGRNPRTGKEIKIPASKAAKFTAGKGLKDALK